MLVTAIDQWVKDVVLDRLTPGVFVSLFGEHIGWQLVFNPGGAWGIPAPSWVFLVVTVIVTVVVVRLLPRAASNWQAIGLGLLLAGALGNVIDRLLRAGDPWFGGGHVVDFVAWGSFPRFNVADAAITVGFVVLLLTTWLHEREVAVRAVAPGAEASQDDDAEQPTGGSDRPGNDHPA